jgi:hypothetical protein
MLRGGPIARASTATLWTVLLLGCWGGDDGRAPGSSKVGTDTEGQQPDLDVVPRGEAWWCSMSRTEPALCYRTFEDCSALSGLLMQDSTVASDGTVVCMDQARAACFTYEDVMRAKKEWQCLSEFSGCETKRRETAGRGRDITGLSECAAVDVARGKATVLFKPGWRNRDAACLEPTPDRPSLLTLVEHRARRPHRPLRRAKRNPRHLIPRQFPGMSRSRRSDRTTISSGLAREIAQRPVLTTACSTTSVGTRRYMENP